MFRVSGRSFPFPFNCLSPCWVQREPLSPERDRGTKWKYYIHISLLLIFLNLLLPLPIAPQYNRATIYFMVELS